MKTNTLSYIKTYIRNGSVIFMALISLLIGVLMTTSTGAWGPSDRATYTIENPASKVTFNSITNNPLHGDERNFVQVKPVSHTTAGGWQDSLAVEVGKEYWVRVYVHNNAAENLNLKALNTRITASIPGSFGKSITVGAQISADNASPKNVWDEAVFTSSKNFRLAYVNGSATWNNNIFTNGTPLPDSIIEAGGTQIGYTSLNGEIPGCFKYDGTALFKVLVQGEEEPDFTVEKKVRKHGDSQWSKSVNVNPGDKIDYQIGYKNTSDSRQDNVQIYDKLPDFVTYQHGSTTLKNANYPDGDGLSVTSNAIISTGIDIGNYPAGGNAFVRFTATAPSEEHLACGENTIRNYGHATTGGETKQDYADIVVKRDCDDTPPVDTPGELPQTGPAEILIAFIGVSLVIFGASYWYYDKRVIKDKKFVALSEDPEESDTEPL